MGDQSKKTPCILTVLISAQSDIQLKSYDSFTILGQIYIVKTAIFDQFYRHQKEWSYIDFKDLLGNGMARGTNLELRQIWCIMYQLLLFSVHN